MIDTIYLFALIAPILALVITRSYDKFEKKDYSKKVYIQIGIMSYLTTVILLYLLKRYNIFFTNNPIDMNAVTTPSAGVAAVVETVSNVIESAPTVNNISTVPISNNAPTSVNNAVSSTTSTSTATKSVLGNVFENIKKVVSSQKGGSVSNSMTYGNEVFHTGKPTF